MPGLVDDLIKDEWERVIRQNPGISERAAFATLGNNLREQIRSDYRRFQETHAQTFSDVFLR